MSSRAPTPPYFITQLLRPFLLAGRTNGWSERGSCFQIASSVFFKKPLHSFNFSSFSHTYQQNIEPLSFGYILLEKCSIHPTGRSNHLSAVIDCSKFPPCSPVFPLLSVYVGRVLKRLSTGGRVSFIGTFAVHRILFCIPCWGILFRKSLDHSCCLAIDIGFMGDLGKLVLLPSASAGFCLNASSVRGQCLSKGAPTCCVYLPSCIQSVPLSDCVGLIPNCLFFKPGKLYYVYNYAGVISGCCVRP